MWYTPLHKELVIFFLFFSRVATCHLPPSGLIVIFSFPPPIFCKSAFLPKASIINFPSVLLVFLCQVFLFTPFVKKGTLWASTKHLLLPSRQRKTVAWGFHVLKARTNADLSVHSWCSWLCSCYRCCCPARSRSPSQNAEINACVSALLLRVSK